MTGSGDAARRGERPAREVREFAAVEFAIDVQAPDSGGEARLLVVGRVVEFGESRSVEDWHGDFVEVVRPGSFTRTLANGIARSLLLGHGGPALAQWRGAGQDGALQIVQDDDAVRVEAAVPLPGSRRGREVRAAVEAARLRAVAAWTVTRCDWLEDGTREIREVKLLDVSLEIGEVAVETIDPPVSGMSVAAASAMLEAAG